MAILKDEQSPGIICSVYLKNGDFVSLQKLSRDQMLGELVVDISDLVSYVLKVSNDPLERLFPPNIPIGILSDCLVAAGYWKVGTTLSFTIINNIKTSELPFRLYLPYIKSKLSQDIHANQDKRIFQKASGLVDSSKNNKQDIKISSNTETVEREILSDSNQSINITKEKNISEVSGESTTLENDPVKLKNTLSILKEESNSSIDFENYIDDFQLDPPVESRVKRNLQRLKLAICAATGSGAAWMNLPHKTQMALSESASVLDWVGFRNNFPPEFASDNVIMFLVSFHVLTSECIRSIHCNALPTDTLKDVLLDKEFGLGLDNIDNIKAVHHSIYLHPHTPIKWLLEKSQSFTNILDIVLEANITVFRKTAFRTAAQRSVRSANSTDHAVYMPLVPWIPPETSLPQKLFWTDTKKGPGLLEIIFGRMIDPKLKVSDVKTEDKAIYISKLTEGLTSKFAYSEKMKLDMLQRELNNIETENEYEISRRSEILRNSTLSAISALPRELFEEASLPDNIGPSIILGEPDVVRDPDGRDRYFKPASINPQEIKLPNSIPVYSYSRILKHYKNSIIGGINMELAKVAAKNISSLKQYERKYRSLVKKYNLKNIDLRKKRDYFLLFQVPKIVSLSMFHRIRKRQKKPSVTTSFQMDKANSSLIEKYRPFQIFQRLFRKSNGSALERNPIPQSLKFHEMYKREWVDTLSPYELQSLQVFQNLNFVKYCYYSDREQNPGNYWARKNTVLSKERMNAARGSKKNN